MSGKVAYLILENGRIFKGKALGREGAAMGEVVFSTSMTAYQEALTDPSYHGQLLTQTFPLLGNYGVNEEDYESDKPAVSGYIVREVCKEPSNFRSTGTLEEFLCKYGILCIEGVDTRSLTRTLRDQGTMNGMITTTPIEQLDLDEVARKLKALTLKGGVEAVTAKASRVCEPENGGVKYRVALWDFGVKNSIIKALTQRGCQVTVVPASATAAEIKALNPDGLLLSNGPGNPEDCAGIVEEIKGLLGEKIPTLGIGLGHQLYAMAHGAAIEKLPHGHRGANQPVKDLSSGRVYITAQNHGYILSSEKIPPASRVSMVNANDGSCEALNYTETPALTVQFYPDGSSRGGGLATAHIYEAFIKMMDNK